MQSLPVTLPVKKTPILILDFMRRSKQKHLVSYEFTASCNTLI